MISLTISQNQNYILFGSGRNLHLCNKYVYTVNEFVGLRIFILIFLQEIRDRDVPVETFDVELIKDSRGLGITIAGYVEQSSGKSICATALIL